MMPGASLQSSSRNQQFFTWGLFPSPFVNRTLLQRLRNAYVRPRTGGDYFGDFFDIPRHLIARRIFNAAFETIVRSNTLTTDSRP